MKRLGLYIHIPFCKKKCSYCDFYSLRYTNDERIEAYVSALCSHIVKEAENYKDYEFDSIFIGGGTPSIMNEQSFNTLAKCIKSHLNITQGAEFTLEANPGTLSREKLMCYLKNGVNRLSLGLQSTDDKELKRLGRIHNLEDFKESYYLARECGFKNISIDVMYGLPDQSVEGFVKTLNQVCEFNPEHISSYCLKIENGTFFGAIKDKLNIPDDDTQYQMYMQMAKILEENGWMQYEISNFAKEGYKSQHNLKYWKSEEFIGFGPSSYSYFNKERYSYSSDIDMYIKECENGTPTRLVELENENCEEDKPVIDKMDEYVMLKLRLAEGVSDKEFNSLFGISFSLAYPRVRKYIESGHIKKENSTYSFTHKGFFVSNYILTDILHF